MALTFPFDPTQFIPTGNKTVLFQSIVAGGSIGNSQTKDDWAVYPLPRREIARSLGAYVALDRTFAHKLTDLPSTPKLRDRLVWNDEVYRIIECNPMVNMDRVTAVARPMRLVQEFTTVVNVYRRTHANTNRSGNTSATPEPVYESIAARVQPMDAGVVEEFGADKLEERYAVIMEIDDAKMYLGDQIRLVGGQALDMDRVLDRDALDMLIRVEAIDRGARWLAA